MSEIFIEVKASGVNVSRRVKKVKPSLSELSLVLGQLKLVELEILDDMSQIKPGFHVRDLGDGK